MISIICCSDKFEVPNVSTLIEIGLVKPIPYEIWISISFAIFAATKFFATHLAA